MWSGYFVTERGDIGAGNWLQLQQLYTDMGTHDSKLPAHNNHDKQRLDGDAVIYESEFEPGEVSVEEFKQLLADEFGVPVEEIDDTQDVTSYSPGNETVVWEFLYNAAVRFTVSRFGRAESWNISGDECRGYLALYKNEWETTE